MEFRGQERKPYVEVERREVRNVRKGQDLRIHKGEPTYNHVKTLGDVDVLHSKKTGLYLGMRDGKHVAHSESMNGLRKKVASRQVSPHLQMSAAEEATRHLGIGSGDSRRGFLERKKHHGIGDNLLDIAGGL